MIKCPKCGNDEIFREDTERLSKSVYWSQNEKGEIEEVNEDYYNSSETVLRCGRCSEDLSELYDEFIRNTT